MTETIDMTPTWAGLLPALLAAYEHGTAEGRRLASLELRRMADVADLHVAASNQGPQHVQESPTIHIGPGRGVSQATADSIARDVERHALQCDENIKTFEKKAKRAKNWRPSEVAMTISSWRQEAASLRFAVDMLRGQAHVMTEAELALAHGGTAAKPE